MTRLRTLLLASLALMFPAIALGASATFNFTSGGGNFGNVRQQASAPTNTGAVSPGTMATSNANGGDRDWSNPNNAMANDAVYAATTAALSTSFPSSYYLKATNFGFSIPAGSTINGVVIEVERKASTGSKIVDGWVRLIKGGTVGSTDQSNAAFWPTTEAYQTYGTSSYLWGTTLTATDVNASNFGMAIAATFSSETGSATPSIDHIRITVYYTPATTYTRTTLTGAVLGTTDSSDVKRSWLTFDPSAAPSSGTQMHAGDTVTAVAVTLHVTAESGSPDVDVGTSSLIGTSDPASMSDSDLFNNGSPADASNYVTATISATGNAVFNLATFTDLQASLDGSGLSTQVVGLDFEADAKSATFDTATVVVTFTPGQVAPTVTSDSSANITSNAAMLAGTVTDDGGATVTERGFVYAVTALPTTSDTKVTSDSGTGNFAKDVTGFAALTTVYWRAYAINSEGTSYGALGTVPTIGTTKTVVYTTTQNPWVPPNDMNTSLPFSVAITSWGTAGQTGGVGGGNGGLGGGYAKWNSVSIANTTGIVIDFSHTGESGQYLSFIKANQSIRLEVGPNQDYGSSTTVPSVFHQGGVGADASLNIPSTLGGGGGGAGGSVGDGGDAEGNAGGDPGVGGGAGGDGSASGVAGKAGRTPGGGGGGGGAGAAGGTYGPGQVVIVYTKTAASTGGTQTYVINDDDTGTGSLRGALTACAAGDIVNLNSHNVTNGSSLLLNTNSITLHGPGSITTGGSNKHTGILASGVTIDGGIHFYAAAHVNQGWGLLIQGAGAGTPAVSNTISGCYFHSGDVAIADGGSCCTNTALSLFDYSANTTITGCTFSEDDWTKYHKMIVLGGSTANLASATYGYSWRGIIKNCTLDGWSRLPSADGGPWLVQDNTIYVPGPGAVESDDAAIWLIGNSFVTRSQPAGAPFWYASGVAAPIVIAGNSPFGTLTNTPALQKIYVEGCTLDGVSKTFAQLTHLYDSSVGYLAAGTVSPQVAKKPHHGAGK